MVRQAQCARYRDAPCHAYQGVLQRRVRGYEIEFDTHLRLRARRVALGRSPLIQYKGDSHENRQCNGVARCPPPEALSSGPSISSTRADSASTLRDPARGLQQARARGA